MRMSEAEAFRFEASTPPPPTPFRALPTFTPPYTRFKFSMGRQLKRPTNIAGSAAARGPPRPTRKVVNTRPLPQTHARPGGCRLKITDRSPLRQPLAAHRFPPPSRQPPSVDPPPHPPQFGAGYGEEINLNYKKLGAAGAARAARFFIQPEVAGTVTSIKMG